MMILKRVSRALDESFMNAGRTRARHDLLGRSDRFLADNGISRKLLESGNEAWPWREQGGEAVMTSGLSLPFQAMGATVLTARPATAESVNISSPAGSSTARHRTGRVDDGASVAESLADQHDVSTPSHERIAA